MTTLYYVCKAANGKTCVTTSYKEAQRIKAEGGTYKVKYKEHRTY